MGNRYFAIKFSQKWLKIESMRITEPAKANQVQHEKSSKQIKQESKATKQIKANQPSNVTNFASTASKQAAKQASQRAKQIDKAT